MKSKVKSHAGRRAKGSAGEREAAHAIEKNCPGLRAERNARNGKATPDVLVWRPDVRLGSWRTTSPVDGNVTSGPVEVDYAKRHLLEVKRVESLDIGTKAMATIRNQAVDDGAIGILWRTNGKGWRLDCVVAVSKTRHLWATVSGDEVWEALTELVEADTPAPAREG